MKVEIDLDKFGHMRVLLPGARASHHIFIPVSLAGLVTLHSILAEREKVPLEAATIGTPAAPTQEMVRAFLSTHQVSTPQSKTKPKISVPGLDLSAMDI